MPREPKPIAEQLRAAIASAERRGVTRYRIAKDSGVTEPSVHRIADGKVFPRLDNAEKIAAALGLRICLAPRR